jgi:DNA-binding NtrC family response regulator/predicted hydrocarbon binding protein
MASGRIADTAAQAAARRAQDELLDMLTFSPEDGRIWLHGKRMMMLDVSSFGALRDELVGRLGPRGARSVLTRIGYASGISDANLIRQRWPTEFRRHAYIGSHLHRLEGITQVEPVRVNWDPERGHFDAEYHWRHTIEDDVNIRSHGLGTEPACWMEAGYATGYVSRMCDQLILFREIECRSMGSQQCRVIAAPAAEFDAVDEELEYLGLPARSRRGRTRPDPRAAVDVLMPSAAEPQPRPAQVGDRPIVGESAAVTAALQLVERVAPTTATVLILGESGVGKELFARALHQLGKRARKPFVAVNCGAIPDTLIEAELFGVERGAFTGASQSRPGRFERAAGGTLFLDEIATLSAVAQTRLLRVLQENEVERVGGTRVIPVDVRVVAATNAPLRQAVEEGRFREDLFFRLNVFPVELPPLRDRRDDIPLLVAHFLRRFNASHGKAVTRLTQRALQALLTFRYPGNVRELEKIIERAVILADGDTADLAHILSSDETPDRSLLFLGSDGKLGPSRTSGGARGLAPQLDLDALAVALLQRCEREGSTDLQAVSAELLARVAQKAVARCGGNVSAAARRLGLKRHQLEYRLGKS